MTSQSPNIVLVSIDSLRGDHCGFLEKGHRQSLNLTPTLDSMAATGVSYHNAIVPGPQTFTSMPAIFTGQYRPVEDLESFPGETHWQRRLAALAAYMETTTTFADRLQQMGYTTAGISPNPWTGSITGFDRGFDRFIDLSTDGTDGLIARMLDSLPGIDSGDRTLRLAINMATNSSFFSRWSDVYAEIEQLRFNLPEPYFLWVFLLDTHFPFLSDRQHRVEQSLPEMYLSNLKGEPWMRGAGDSDHMPKRVCHAMRRGYRDTVRMVDTFLDRLADLLETDDPVFLVHSDHGESFGEHGNYGHHHRQPYEENVHVPFVVYNGDNTAAIDDPVSLVAIPDVIQSIARTGTFDPHDVTSEYVFVRGEYGRRQAVRGQQYKYVELADNSLLVDLESDPGEHRDLSERRPELLASFLDELARFDATDREQKRIRTVTSEVLAETTI